MALYSRALKADEKPRLEELLNDEDEELATERRGGEAHTPTIVSGPPALLEASLKRCRTTPEAAAPSRNQ